MVAPAVILVGATLTFAGVAGVVVAAARRSSRLRWGPPILLVTGAVWLVVVALLWLDGRIGRYFVPPFWLVIAAGPPVGAAVGTNRAGTPVATAAWTTVYAGTFAAGLPFGVPLGSAAVLGHAVETVTAVFVALPGVLVGAGVGATGED
ncbi:hypothetical protein BRC85_10580 [Halobacteriales archaeon QS_1_69_70]|nr:MAG: hypothetical protein BRC85_10580 [Halobacteriales archaeon QS_1_69_70]